MSKVVTICLFFFSINCWAQNLHPLSGRVVDVNGKGLGFSSIKTADNFMITDKDGFFKFVLPSGSYQLKVRSVGYHERTFNCILPQKRQLHIVLSEDIQALKEVVVTATRNSSSIDNIPLPVEVIKAKQIEQIGALRINEVLQEQTGLQLTSGHGSGLMMQGLTSDYILFMIDGEPVIGRTAGTLELNRLAVDNIKRIEIIRGPSSSLYGNEAMAGVVNIITKKAKNGFEGTLRSRYRSFVTSDISGNIGYAGERFSADLFVNRLSTEGYDLNKASIAMTAPPYQSFTINPKIGYRFSDDLKLTINGRFYQELQQNISDVVTTAEDTIRLDERGKRQDWSVMPTLEWMVADSHHLQLRSYTTNYQTNTTLSRQKDNSIYDESYFNQQFNRLELQYDWYINDQHITTSGIGQTIETVEATRYAEVNALKATYGFVQHQWLPNKEFNMIVGGRYTTHNAYANRFSPKVAASYQLKPWLKVQASFGGGYKAPDFRQLLLDFTNPTVGYTVIGSNILKERMAALTAEGQVAALYINPEKIETIQAESSIAYNLGLQLNPIKKLNMEWNFFRNEISNMINTVAIARKTNGQNIFSYRNMEEVITQGFDVNVDYPILPSLNFSAGYQYLDAKNMEDIARIKNGEVFRRDQTTNRTVVVKLSEYGGLANRSRHSANAKLFYTNSRHNYGASLRGIYRGRYGIADANGNGLIDADNEYIKGYLLLNFAIHKQLFEWLTLEAGANNLLNATNPMESSLAGRTWFGGLQINFSKINHNNK